MQGGVALWFLPIGVPLVYAILDAIVGAERGNADPSTSEGALFWHRLVTIIWAPIQIGTVFSIMAYVTMTDHLSALSEWFLFYGLGFMAGVIGITYSHELLHQKPKFERWLADILLASVSYSHLRSEHLLVHHRYVGTRKDPVTARYDEGFHHFFWRVVWQSLISSFRAEEALLARKNRPWWDRSNPFWRYWVLQLGFLTLSYVIGGWWGIALFLTQSFNAFFFLELVNYIEHYGLTREHLGGGKYEHTRPHHSWNADPMFSNWLLINLQRHSDHHFNPSRRFPLLQTYGEDDAPQLPYGYATMSFIAMFPPLWRRVMNPRVDAWRARHYPHINDWEPYNTATNPMPR